MAEKNDRNGYQADGRSISTTETDIRPMKVREAKLESTIGSTKVWETDEGNKTWEREQKGDITMKTSQEKQENKNIRHENVI
jgi:hypothetical protein